MDFGEMSGSYHSWSWSNLINGLCENEWKLSFMKLKQFQKWILGKCMENRFMDIGIEMDWFGESIIIHEPEIWPNRAFSWETSRILTMIPRRSQWGHYNLEKNAEHLEETMFFFYRQWQWQGCLAKLVHPIPGPEESSLDRSDISKIKYP